ncbi:MAG: hypothetical protein AVDCRST_MAG66-1569, partial [uncultured Pseudonocardia sp.]
ARCHRLGHRHLAQDHPRPRGRRRGGVAAARPRLGLVLAHHRRRRGRGSVPGPATDPGVALRSRAALVVDPM